MPEALLDYIWVLWPFSILIPCLVARHWRTRALAAERVIGQGDRLRYYLLLKADQRNSELRAARRQVANRTVAETLAEDYTPAERRAS